MWFLQVSYFIDLITRCFKGEKNMEEYTEGENRKRQVLSEDWVVKPPPFPGNASETLELSHAKD